MVNGTVPCTSNGHGHSILALVNFEDTELWAVNPTDWVGPHPTNRNDSHDKRTAKTCDSAGESEVADPELSLETEDVDEAAKLGVGSGLGHCT